MKRLASAAAAAASLALAGSAHAIDITAATGDLAEGLGNVTTIGAAVLAITVVIAVFKYVRKAF